MGFALEVCLAYGLHCRVCGYLCSLGVDAIAGANRRAWELLSRCRVEARLDFMAERAVTVARDGAMCVLQMVDSPMWSPSIDGIREHARAELGNICDLMAEPTGFLMAFKAWQHVEAVLQMPSDQAWPVFEVRFHGEVNRTLLSVKHAVCEIMALEVQKLVPLGQRRLFAEELSRQYGMLEEGDRVAERMERRIFEQVFMAHSRSIGKYVRGAVLGRNDRRFRVRRW